MTPWVWFVFGFAFCLSLEFILALFWLAPYIRDSMRGK